MFLALIAMAAAEERMRYCSKETRGEGPPDGAVVEILSGGHAVIISPDGYAIAHQELVSDHGVDLRYGGFSREAEVIEIDEASEAALLSFERPAAWGCAAMSPKVYATLPVWSVDEDGDWLEGTVAEDDWRISNDLGAPPYAPVLSGDALVGLTLEGGTTMKFETGTPVGLGIRWAFEAVGVPESDPPWRVGLAIVGFIGLLGLMLWRVRAPQVDKNIRGTRSDTPAGCPYMWVQMAEELGLEVDGPGLSGSIDGFPVRCSYGDDTTTVHVRISPPHGMQAIHKERAANIREPLDLDNPVADSLIAVGGEPELVELLHDEAVLGPVLEVVHGRPGSTIDSEGVTLRAGGKWTDQLPTLIDQALAAARALSG